MRRYVIAFLLVCLASTALAQSPPLPKKPATPARARSIMPERDEDRSTHPGTGLERRFWACRLLKKIPL